MLTVLPTELSVEATLSVTVRWAISMTRARPMASPRMRMIDTVLVALRNALRMPLPTVVISPLTPAAIELSSVTLVPVGRFRKGFAASQRLPTSP